MRSQGAMSTHSLGWCMEAALDLLFHISSSAARRSAAQLADYTRRESVSPEFQCTNVSQLKTLHGSAAEVHTWTLLGARASGGEIINREPHPASEREIPRECVSRSLTK